MLRSLFVCHFALLVALSAAWADDVPKPATEQPVASLAESSPEEKSSANGSGDAKKTPVKVEHSDAERVADLNETLSSERARLKELEAELNDPASDYAQAEKEFQELDRALEQKQEALAKFKADGKTAAAAALTKDIASVEKQRQRAKDRFELALEELLRLRPCP